MSRVVAYERGMQPLGRAVVALGVFDGVHVGHQALVQDAVSVAKRASVASVVVTFDRDPDRVLTPALAAPQLLPAEDKFDLLASLGPDAVLVVPFDDGLASLTPDAFLDDVLLPVVTPVVVVVGHDFRFGARASGDVAALERLGLARGFSVTPHELVVADGVPVTSTRIRALIVAGDVSRAATLLGRPHRLVGPVVAGRGDGRALGVPTANVAPPPEAAVPAPGVYACAVDIDGRRHAAGVSVGRPPSFPGAEEAVEAHLLGYEGDLYGRTLRVEFLERLRDMRPFASHDELKAAMAEDLRRAREAFDRSAY